MILIHQATPEEKEAYAKLYPFLELEEVRSTDDDLWSIIEDLYAPD
jgi:hypothetical protein